MNYTINLFSEKKEVLEKFLESYYKYKVKLNTDLSYEKKFGNPVDMIEIISTLIDNNDKFNIGVWISIDKDIFINITEKNLDRIIKFLIERYPTK